MKAMKRPVDDLHLNTKSPFLTHVSNSTISCRTFERTFIDFQFEAILEFL